MKVVITGASGMVGGEVLKRCLSDDKITEVISFVRRSMNLKDAKLKEIIQSDFEDYSASMAAFENVHAAFFCLGAYTGAVKDDLFKKITVDFSNAFADAVASSSPSANFCLLSGMGADQTEQSNTSFAKYKGMAENYLQSKNFGELYLFRPGYIYPVEKRKEPNLMYNVSRALYPVLKFMGPKYSITSMQLGNAIFKAGITGAPIQILENKAILEFLG